MTLCEEDKGFKKNLFKAHVQCNIFHINKIKWGPDECILFCIKFLLVVSRLPIWIVHWRIHQYLFVNIDAKWWLTRSFTQWARYKSLGHKVKDLQILWSQNSISFTVIWFFLLFYIVYNWLSFIWFVCRQLVCNDFSRPALRLNYTTNKIYLYH